MRPGAVFSTGRFSSTPTGHVGHNSSRQKWTDRRRSESLRFPRVQPASRIERATSHRSHLPQASTATSRSVHAGQGAFALQAPTPRPNSRAADSFRSGEVDDPTGQIERFRRSEACTSGAGGTRTHGRRIMSPLLCSTARFAPSTPPVANIRRATPGPSIPALRRPPSPRHSAAGCVEKPAVHPGLPGWSEARARVQDPGHSRTDASSADGSSPVSTGQCGYRTCTTMRPRICSGAPLKATASAIGLALPAITPSHPAPDPMACQRGNDQG